MSDIYVPHETQRLAHKAFLVDGYKRGTIFWGRRVGKSRWSRQQLFISALYKQGPYWVVFDTEEHAVDVMWESLLKEIPEQYIDQKKTNAQKHIITFKYVKQAINLPGLGWQVIKHDQELPPSTIQLTGSDTADRDRGNEAMGILFDEYQDQQPDKWEEVYEPFLATTDGWACFMGTAKGYNHWYDMMEDSKEQSDWFHSEATWRDSPYISKEFIEKSKQTAARRGKLDIWMREYELKFMTPQKAVYPMFDRAVHVVKPDDVPEDGTIYGIWDFGFAEGHPMAFGLVLIDTQGQWWLFDELFGTGIDIDNAIEMIRTKIGTRKIEGVVADSARPDLIDYARSKGMNIIPAPKRQGSIESGIGLLRQRLSLKAQITGSLGADLFFTRNCRNAVIQFEKYSYKEAKDDRPTSELPIKKDDDMPDALRYLALYLKYGLVKKKKKKATTLREDQYGIAHF